MLERVVDWLLSDTGWKVATVAFAGTAWLIRRASKQVRTQIKGLVVPLEQGIEDNRREIANNKADIEALNKAARDQNGANEKVYATKEYVNDRVSGIERHIGSLDENVRSLVNRLDGLFTSIMNHK